MVFIDIGWEALIKLSKETKPDVPQLSNNINPIKWIEYLEDFLFRNYEIRDWPLIYVIKDTVEIPDEAYDLLQLSWSYGQYDFVLEEFIARLDHVNTIFKSYITSVYSTMEEAAHGTVYAPTIKH